ncbi:hypothetical protein AXK11_04985 [Cephaloticoccus primus]|uniref:Uncharacterized protein n=1 Tax=Cephaloticoccus primus TaxID=1548207 RepID=A0A139SN30_9BACT|nr:hypothetical protein AXK11_04985 [Cephaloticoccus primus]
MMKVKLASTDKDFSDEVGTGCGKVYAAFANDIEDRRGVAGDRAVDLNHFSLGGLYGVGTTDNELCACWNYGEGEPYDKCQYGVGGFEIA